MQVLALALIFVFLCLAALYESWSVPFAVLLTIPIGIFGALFMRHDDNAILIVEFAKVRTDKGMDAKKAAHLRGGFETSTNHHDFAGFYNRLLAHAVVSGMLAATQITSAEFRELNLDEAIDLALKNNRKRRATGLSMTWSGAVNKIGGDDYIIRRAASDSNYNKAFDNTLRFNIASAQFNLNSADLNLENTKNRRRARQRYSFFQNSIARHHSKRLRQRAYTEISKLHFESMSISKAFSKINFNPKYFTDPARLAKEFDSGYCIKSMSAFGAGAHEAGHLIAAFRRRKLS